MNRSVLDQQLSLAELLDVDGFRDVCRSFSELYGVGIKVFDLEGAKIADVRASTGDHCGYLFTVHPTQVACTNLVNQIRTCELDPDAPAQTVRCFSGLEYKLAPLKYEGTVLGRFIFGPYAPEGLSGPPKELKQYEPQLSLSRLAGYLERIPRAADTTVIKLIQHVTQVLQVIIHSSHRAQMTSKLHIESIKGAFADLEKSNKSLKHANDKLQDLDRLKSNFIATVSHELRTPLTSVIGYSEMLLEGMAGDLTQEQRDYVSTILEKGENLLNLIGQVLDLSRIESGNVLMQRRESDIRELAQLSLSDIMPQAKKRDIKIAIEVGEEVTPIEVDGDKIRRVITNLLTNAVKFTPPGGTIRVAIDVHETQPEEGERFDRFEPERNRHMQICVIDPGIGIPEEKLDDIFDAFFQVDNTSTREFGGTGLGLAIARNFVTAHGGQVEVSSELTKGSTFTVLLPYVHEPIDDTMSIEILSSGR